LIRISITPAAFEAIASTLKLRLGGRRALHQRARRKTVWLEEVWVDRLGAMRGQGESYSAVILRLVDVTGSGMEGACAP
jgi:hypothetical protein